MNNDLPVYSTANEALALSVKTYLNKWQGETLFYYAKNDFAREPFIVMLINGLYRSSATQNTIADFAAGIAFALEFREEIEK